METINQDQNASDPEKSQEKTDQEIAKDLAVKTKELRNKWMKKIKSAYEYTKDRFDEEAQKYVKMYLHEFEGALPERFLSADKLDVNVVYPIVKSLVPSLYFQDPKVYVKALQEKIVQPVMIVNEETEQSELVLDPNTGQPLLKEYDAVNSAKILQNALNQNIDKAKLKYSVKDSIVDAELTYYGALKLGWGNEQGVASMGEEGVPPSSREDVYDDLAYGIRLKPWDVVVDLTNFYNPKWIAIRYCVSPEQLKGDKRLTNTEKLVGKSKVDDDTKNKMFKHMDKEDLAQVEYFEVYVKPSAEYPLGMYFMITEEIDNDFLYISDWPLEAKDFPVKLLYFNRNPNGGFPIPDARYYANHQKAKLNIRNAEYEYVQRTIPVTVVNTMGMKNPENFIKRFESGNIPRAISSNQPANKVLGGYQHPALSIDFRQLEMNVDNDISKIVGLTSAVTPTSDADNQLATALKVSDRNEQMRQNERADIVSDFMASIVEYWAKLYQEFAGPENYTEVDGERFPVMWSGEEINGKFKFKIKPFSMSYEDPIILRRQWVDLLNLLSSPEARMALAEQGAMVDILKIVKRILETYDEPDVNNFVIDDMAKPENQVAFAIQENMAMAQGQPVAVTPLDNHKVHLMIHQLVLPASEAHMQEHQMAMQEQMQMSMSGGGGNKENPNGVNGVATDQGQMREPLEPSAVNQSAKNKSNATKTR